MLLPEPVDEAPPAAPGADAPPPALPLLLPPRPGVDDDVPPRDPPRPLGRAPPAPPPIALGRASPAPVDPLVGVSPALPSLRPPRPPSRPPEPKPLTPSCLRSWCLKEGGIEGSGWLAPGKNGTGEKPASKPLGPLANVVLGLSPLPRPAPPPRPPPKPGKPGKPGKPLVGDSLMPERLPPLLLGKVSSAPPTCWFDPCA